MFLSYMKHVVCFLKLLIHKYRYVCNYYIMFDILVLIWLIFLTPSLRIFVKYGGVPVILNTIWAGTLSSMLKLRLFPTRLGLWRLLYPLSGKYFPMFPRRILIIPIIGQVFSYVSNKNTCYTHYRASIFICFQK